MRVHWGYCNKRKDVGGKGLGATNNLNVWGANILEIREYIVSEEAEWDTIGQFIESWFL